MDLRDLMLWRWPPRTGEAGQPEAAETLHTLQADINRAFESFWRGVPTPSFRANWGMTLQSIEIRVDLLETEKAIEITAEMPGLEERDIEVALGENCIIIKAEKHAVHQNQGGGLRIGERLYGSMQRAITLPAMVDQDAIKASYKNGVLTIVVPKLADTSQNVKHIPINNS